MLMIKEGIAKTIPAARVAEFKAAGWVELKLPKKGKEKEA